MKQLLIVILTLFFFDIQAQVAKSISLGTAVNLGNLNSFNINLQSSFGQDSAKVNWNISPSFSFTMMKSDSKFMIYERESYLTTSVSKKFGKWKVIGFSDAENSYLRKTLFRFTGGVGTGYDIVNNQKVKFSVSEVIMPECYISSDKSNKDIISIRPSTRFKLKYNDKINFESVTYFQPSFWTSNNIRFVDNINFRTTNTLDVPITKHLSIGTQVIVQVFTLPHYFDNSVKITDTNLSFLLKAYF